MRFEVAFLKRTFIAQDGGRAGEGRWVSCGCLESNFDYVEGLAWKIEVLAQVDLQLGRLRHLLQTRMEVWILFHQMQLASQAVCVERCREHVRSTFR